MQLRGEREKAAHSLSTRHTQRVPGTWIDQFNSTSTSTKILCSFNSLFWWCTLFWFQLFLAYYTTSLWDLNLENIRPSGHELQNIMNKAGPAPTSPSLSLSFTDTLRATAKRSERAGLTEQNVVRSSEKGAADEYLTTYIAYFTPPTKRPSDQTERANHFSSEEFQDSSVFF